MWMELTGAGAFADDCCIDLLQCQHIGGDTQIYATLAGRLPDCFGL
jgi:hypothetical protein